MTTLTRDDLEAAAHWTQEPGDEIAGTVARLPEASVYQGRSLVLRGDDGGYVLVDAHPAEGHTVLARELERLNVTTGDRVSVEFAGWREGGRGQRYRHYRVRVQGPAPAARA